jgi:hypothetical protein
MCFVHSVEPAPEDFEWRWPVWMERRIAELRAAGKTADEAAAILLEEARR